MDERLKEKKIPKMGAKIKIFIYVHDNMFTPCSFDVMCN